MDKKRWEWYHHFLGLPQPEIDWYKNIVGSLVKTDRSVWSTDLSKFVVFDDVKEFVDSHACDTSSNKELRRGVQLLRDLKHYLDENTEKILAHMSIIYWHRKHITNLKDPLTDKFKEDIEEKRSAANLYQKNMPPSKMVDKTSIKTSLKKKVGNPSLKKRKVVSGLPMDESSVDVNVGMKVGGTPVPHKSNIDTNVNVSFNKKKVGGKPTTLNKSTINFVMPSSKRTNLIRNENVEGSSSSDKEDSDPDEPEEGAEPTHSSDDNSSDDEDPCYAALSKEGRPFLDDDIILDPYSISSKRKRFDPKNFDLKNFPKNTNDDIDDDDTTLMDEFEDFLQQESSGPSSSTEGKNFRVKNPASFLKEYVVEESTEDPIVYPDLEKGDFQLLLTLGQLLSKIKPPSKVDKKDEEEIDKVIKDLTARAQKLLQIFLDQNPCLAINGVNNTSKIPRMVKVSSYTCQQAISNVKKFVNKHDIDDEAFSLLHCIEMKYKTRPKKKRPIIDVKIEPLFAFVELTKKLKEKSGLSELKDHPHILKYKENIDYYFAKQKIILQMTHAVWRAHCCSPFPNNAVHVSHLCHNPYCFFLKHLTLESASLNQNRSISCFIGVLCCLKCHTSIGCCTCVGVIRGCLKAKSYYCPKCCQLKDLKDFRDKTSVLNKQLNNNYI